jgi:hypothetical protein
LTTKYPSIPIPSADVPSIHQAVSAIRQTVSLLIVNQQSSSQEILAKAAQVFATTDHVNNALKSISLTPGPAGPQGPQGAQGTTGTADSTGPTPATSPPLANGQASAGFSASYARADHVHPKDTTTPVYGSLPPSALDDSAAASMGIPVGGVYRNGSIMMVRVS